MMKSLFALLVLASAATTSAATSSALPLDVSGQWVPEGECQCLEYGAACRETPPAFHVFYKSSIKEGFGGIAETGTTVTGPNGHPKSVTLWIYGNEVVDSSKNLKVRKGDRLEFAISQSGNRIEITAVNKSLAQKPFSMALIAPDAQEGGTVGGPSEIVTAADSTGFFTKITKRDSTDATAGPPVGTRIVQLKDFFMINKDDANHLDVRLAYDYRQNPTWDPYDENGAVFNSGAVSCRFKRK